MTRIYSLCIVLVFLSACLTPNEVTNFQNGSFSKNTFTTIVNEQQDYRLKSHDVLSIKVRGLDPNSYNFLNLQDEQSSQNVTESSLFLNGYPISESGYISLPTIGQVYACDFTLTELQNVLQEKVNEYVKNATVIVKMVSFKISVLGEVEDPTTFFSYNSQITLLEALARAGDLKEFGDRREITLVRQTPAGPQVTLVDLTQSDFMGSPFYYLQPNDILYVKPMEEKSKRSNLNNLKVFNTVFSGISASVATLFLINQIKN